MVKRVAWKLAGGILQVTGILLMIDCAVVAVFLLGYSFDETAEISGGLIFLIIVVSVISIGVPGYFLYKYGKKILRKPENILEPNHNVTRKVKQVKVAEKGTLFEDKPLNNLFNTTFPQGNNGSLSSSYTFTQTISTSDMSPLNGERPRQETAETPIQPRVISCKGCGANNIIKSDEAKCEYCGGYLT